MSVFARFRALRACFISKRLSAVTNDPGGSSRARASAKSLLDRSISCALPARVKKTMLMRIPNGSKRSLMISGIVSLLGLFTAFPVLSVTTVRQHEQGLHTVGGSQIRLRGTHHDLHQRSFKPRANLVELPYKFVNLTGRPFLGRAQLMDSTRRGHQRAS